MNQILENAIKIHNERPREWWRMPTTGRRPSLVMTNGQWLTVQPMPKGCGKVSSNRERTAQAEPWLSAKPTEEHTVDYYRFLNWALRRGPERGERFMLPDGRNVICGDRQLLFGRVFDRANIVDALQLLFQEGGRPMLRLEFVPSGRREDSGYETPILRIVAGKITLIVVGCYSFHETGSDPFPVVPR